jgi:hypothetical protein
MNINITINAGTENEGVSTKPSLGTHELPIKLAGLQESHDDVVNKMGDDFAPLPKAFLGGYSSHFRITLEFPNLHNTDEGGVVSIVSPPALQTVAWSDPFIYSSSEKDSRNIRFPLPEGSRLPASIKQSDFFAQPPGYFVDGKETVWLQILNLDATMDSSIGAIRIILGETLLREHENIFKPSLGVATSLGKSGFPVRLFFNPYALIQTEFGSFRAIHGTLAYGRVTAFPPVGTPVSIADCIPLESLESVQSENMDRNPVGRIVALSHPIDMALQVRGSEAYQFVEQVIAKQPARYRALSTSVQGIPRINR